jgi:hypothetical protein
MSEQFVVGSWDRACGIANNLEDVTPGAGHYYMKGYHKRRYIERQAVKGMEPRKFENE